MPPHFHDIMPEVLRIVGDAIQDGLIKSVRYKKFKKTVEKLKEEDRQAELEDYLQKLWDEL